MAASGSAAGPDGPTDELRALRAGLRLLRPLWADVLPLSGASELTEAAGAPLDAAAAALVAAGVPVETVEVDGRPHVYLPVAGNRHALLPGRESCSVRGCDLPSGTGGMRCVVHRLPTERLDHSGCPGEVWEPLPFDPDVVVSSCGCVKSLRSHQSEGGRTLSQRLDSNGVARVSLASSRRRGLVRGGDLSVAGLVLLAHVGEPPEGDGRAVAHHLDGDHRNNHLANLEWRRQVGTDHPRARARRER